MTPTPGTGAAERARVLLVDDEPLVLEALRDLLRRRPYVLRFAHSAEEALVLLRGEGADVVVSDERMPGLSGTALMAILARELPAVPRIILTGHATVETALRAINGGRVLQFLRKPCRAEELEAAIETALKERSRQVAQAQLARAALALVDGDGGQADPAPARAPSAPSLAVGAFPASCMRLLSPREREVFDLVVEGYRVSQVAKRLFRSEHTVRNHLKACFEKLEVHSQAELVARARQPSPPPNGDPG